MFKVRDNIDLETLVFYGFEYNEDYNSYIKKTPNGGKLCISIRVFCQDRTVLCYNIFDEIIYDLIKDNIIAKEEQLSAENVIKIKLKDLTLGQLYSASDKGHGIVEEEYGILTDILHYGWLGCIAAILERQNLDAEVCID